MGDVLSSLVEWIGRSTLQRTTKEKRTGSVTASDQKFRRKPRSKGSEYFTCVSGDVDLRNKNREIKMRGVPHEMTNLVPPTTDT